MHWKYRTYKLVKDMRIVLKLTKLWLLWFSGLIGWYVGWTPGSATCFVGPTPNKVSPSTLHCYFFSPFCNNTDLLICKLCKLRGNIFGETVGCFFFASFYLAGWSFRKLLTIVNHFSDLFLPLHLRICF